MQPGRGLQPRVKHAADPQSLMDWVTEGANVTVGDFAVDGTGLVYSAIDPPPGARGALKLRMCDGRLWDGLVMIGGLIVGAALLRLRWGTRLWILAWLTLLWCIASVVFPIAAAQMVDRTLFLVGTGVFVVWLFSDAVRKRPKRPPHGFIPDEVSGEPPPAGGPLSAEIPPLPAEAVPPAVRESGDAVSAAVVLEDDDVMIEKRKSRTEAAPDAADRPRPETTASEDLRPQEGDRRHDPE